MCRSEADDDPNSPPAARIQSRQSERAMPNDTVLLNCVLGHIAVIWIRREARRRYGHAAFAACVHAFVRESNIPVGGSSPVGRDVHSKYNLIYSYKN